MQIKGSTCIVTGGAGGIGSGCVKLLLENGAKVVIFDVLPQEKGDEVAKGYGKDVMYVQADITNSEKCKAAVEKAATFGALKILVHCAGIAKKREWSNDLADSIADFELMLKVNTTGTFIIDAHFADAINKPFNHPNGEDKRKEFWTVKDEEERGVIVNFASAAAHGCYARCLTYAPTKCAVIGITRTMSDFLGPSGIRVNSVSPSIVASNMTGGFSGYYDDDLKKHATFPREPMTPGDIAGTVKYIIESRYLNGQDIAVDSGWRLVTQKVGVDGGADPRTLAPGLE